MQFKISGVHSGLLGLDLPFNLNFMVTGRVRGAFTVEMLQSALDRLRQRHPMLATRIAPASENAPACLTTEGVPPIPLRVVERTTDLDWPNAVEQELAKPTNYATGPLFRCVWVRGADVSELVLVCDHIGGDGLAGIYALRTLMELLADPDLNPEPMIPRTMGELIPPAILTRMKEMIAAFPPFNPDDMNDMPPAQVDNRPVRVIPFTFDETITKSLVARCRLENTTVHAALSTAFVLTFAEMHPEEPIRKIESPINIRQRLSEPVGEVYGDYISLANNDIDCTPGQNAWQIARRFRQDLAAITDDELFTIPRSLIAIADTPPGGPIVDVNYDLSLSNLGRVNIPSQYGPFTLESIYAPTIGPANPNHRIVGVTTFNEQMCCTFSSRDQQAPQIIQRTREILDQMLSDKPFIS